MTEKDSETVMDVALFRAELVDTEDIAKNLSSDAARWAESGGM